MPSLAAVHVLGLRSEFFSQTPLSCRNEDQLAPGVRSNTVRINAPVQCMAGRSILLADQTSRVGYASVHGGFRIFTTGIVIHTGRLGRLRRLSWALALNDPSSSARRG